MEAPKPAKIRLATIATQDNRHSFENCHPVLQDEISLVTKGQEIDKFQVIDSQVAQTLCLSDQRRIIDRTRASKGVPLEHQLGYQARTILGLEAHVYGSKLIKLITRKEKLPPCCNLLPVAKVNLPINFAQLLAS